MKTKAVNKIVELMKDPNEQWDVNQHTVIHKKSQIAVWYATGLFFMNLYPCELPLNIFEKWKLKNAVKHVINNHFLNRLAK